MGSYPVAVCYSIGQDNAIQYNTKHTSHTITYTTQTTLYTQNYKKNKIQNTYYTLKTQKRVEPKVDESV
jgi:hypothetical protein